MPKYVIDTNFIIRYLIADNKEQYEKSKDVFNKARDGEIILILEQPVFVEVIFVLSSFYKVPKESIVETMLSLISYKGIDSDRPILQKALEIFQDNTIHIVDAIVAAKCNLSQIQAYTFDQKLEKLIKSS